MSDPETGTDPSTGDSDRSEQLVAQHLRDFIVGSMRLMTGINNGNFMIVHRDLVQLLKCLSEKKVDARVVLATVLQDLREQAEGRDCEGEYDHAELALINSAFKLALEMTSADGFARARRSRRQTEFSQLFDRLVVENELKSRRNGWSYLGKLSERPDLRTEQGRRKPSRRKSITSTQPPAAPKGK